MDDVVALARGRDVVIVYVYSDDQVRSVVLDGGLAEAMEPGSTIVIHTTASPRTIEAIAARVGPDGRRRGGCPGERGTGAGG